MAPLQEYQNQTIYYAGRQILTAVLRDLLQNRAMSQATDVVMSGCSAGGLAVYLHADFVASLLPPATKFRVIADSGFFKRESANIAGMRWVAKTMATSTNQACESAQADPSECIFAEVVSRFIKTPLFALQSVVDRSQVGAPPSGGGCCSNCTTQAAINTFALRFNDVLHGGLFEGPLAASHGGFIDSCHHHCGSWAGDGTEGVLDPRVNHTASGEAFLAWYDDKVELSTVWQQALPQPSDPMCDTCCHPPHATDVSDSTTYQ